MYRNTICCSGTFIDKTLRKCNFSSFPLTYMQNYLRKHVQSEIAQHFVVASIKNTQENACKTLLAEQPGRKSCENSSKIVIQLCYHHHEVKIPRAYACKTLTQDLLDGKLCEIPKKNQRKSKGGRRAKKVPKTRDMCRKWSECDTCRRNVTWRLRMGHLSTKRSLGGQNAIHVAETPSRRSECNKGRENAAWVFRTRYMSKKRT